MEILYGKPARSVKRFSRFKWLTAVVLLLLLLLIWFSGSNGPGVGKGGTAVDGPSHVVAPGSFSIERRGDGRLVVRGKVSDTTTRDQWLNAIRIGAQGARVTDDVKIDAATPASDWAGQLSSLVAVIRERKLEGLNIDGDKVVLKGDVGTASDKAEVERMVQAQLPTGYRLDSRLAIAGAAAPTEVASAAGGKTGPAGADRQTSSASVSSPSASSGSAASTSDSSSSPSPGSASSPSASSTPKAPSKAASAASTSEANSAAMPPSSAPGSAPSKAAADGQSGARSSATPAEAVAKPGRAVSPAGVASSKDSRQPGKTAARKPVNCPRQIRSLTRPIYFKTDESIISSEDRARLERLGACMGRARLRIVGHTDPRHTDEYNLELSQRRARTVADALEAGGAQSSRITVVAAGKTKPSAKGASREALQRSRRVDILIK